MPGTNPPTVRQFTSDQTSLWIQPNGCGEPPVMLGCVGIDSMDVPRGDIKKILCASPTTIGEFEVQASIRTAPKDVDFTIVSNVGSETTWMNKFANEVHCPFPMYLLVRCKGKKNIFGSFDFALQLIGTEIEGFAYKNLIGRDQLDGIEKSYKIKVGAPDVHEILMPKVTAQTVETASDLFAIAFAGDTECGGPCGDPKRDCETGFAIGGTDGIAGALMSNSMPACIGYENTVGATMPFGATDTVSSMLISRLTSEPRIIVTLGNATLGVPMKVAYSDDNAKTWSVVELPPNNHFSTANSLFQRSDGSIWLVTHEGYIYASFDNGSNWVAREMGALTSGGGLTNIHFYDNVNGMAVGMDGKILVTQDGGEAWFLLDTVPDDLQRISPTIQQINTVYYTNGAWFIGTFDGHVYRTRDYKVWSDIPFSGQLNGQIDQIQFYGCAGVILYNELVSTLPDVYRGKVLYTINGYNWESLTVPPNRGLWSVSMLNATEFYIAGSAYNGHGTILKGTAYPFA